MKDKLVIIDNDFITKEEANQFKEKVLGHPTALWKFETFTSYEQDRELDSNIKDSHQFVSAIGNVNPLRKPALDLFNKFVSKHNISYSEITRIKFNVVPRGSAENAGKWHMPHVDTDKPHKVFLYYLNDADGDTYFFNRYHELGDDAKDVNGLEVSQTVSPEGGKGVVFDGLIYHSSSSPIVSDYRVVLNIDFV